MNMNGSTVKPIANPAPFPNASAKSLLTTKNTIILTTGTRKRMSHQPGRSTLEITWMEFNLQKGIRWILADHGNAKVYWF
jgi:hypothetical protein